MIIKNKASKEFLKSMSFTFVKTFEDEYSNGALMDQFVIQAKNYIK